MKETFPEYYRHSDEELGSIWEECTFALDASALLALYKLPATARDSVFTALERVRERLWTPHHAALEYQRNRLTVIAEQKSMMPKLSDQIEKTLTDLRRSLTGPSSVAPTGKLEPIFKALEDCKAHLAELEAAQADVHDDDGVRSRIDDLLAGRVGPRPSQESVNTIEKEGAQRFSDQVPPGYKDAAKADSFVSRGVKYQRKFGDLHLWKQTLEFVREKKLKSLVLITNDTKEDWWLRASGKTLGPHPELSAECLAAGAQAFHMYTLPQFLEYSSKRASVPLSRETMEQVTGVLDSGDHVSTITPFVFLTLESADRDIVKKLRFSVHNSFRGKYELVQTSPTKMTLLSSELLPVETVSNVMDHIIELPGVASVMSPIYPQLGSYTGPGGRKSRTIQVKFMEQNIISTGVIRALDELTRGYFGPDVSIWQFSGDSLAIEINQPVVDSVFRSYMHELQNLPSMLDAHLSWH